MLNYQANLAVEATRSERGREKRGSGRCVNANWICLGSNGGWLEWLTTDKDQISGVMNTIFNYGPQHELCCV